MLARLSLYAKLMRLHRPIGTLLLLWPTLWALWLASEGQPDPFITMIFVLGVILMRAAGCVINDYADRKIDAHVQRTRDRPLATGQVSSREALVLFAVLCLIAFALVLTLNQLTIMMSMIAVLLAASYPFMKRFTHLPQVHLGLAFGWAVPMAYTAVTGNMPSQEAWLLLIAVVLWALAYDTMYAMVDREDDLRIGVKSTAILFAELDRLIIGFVQLLLLGVLLLIGSRLSLAWPYYAGLAAAAVLAAYQQYLIRNRQRDACFRAFLNNNWFGAVIFLGIFISYL